MQKISILALLLLFLTVSWATADEKTVSNISPAGTVVTFDDGSVYQIDPADSWKTYNWMEGDEVRIPDTEPFKPLIRDKSDGSTAHATRIE